MLDQNQSHTKHQASQNVIPAFVSLILTDLASTCRYLFRTFLQLFVVSRRGKPYLDAEQATRYQELVEIVEKLKMLGQKVRVKINGDHHIYTSIITAVSPEYGMLVIKNFRPRVKESLSFGRIINIEVEKSDGQKIDIPCYYIDALVPNINLGYQLKLPMMLASAELT